MFIKVQEQYRDEFIDSVGGIVNESSYFKLQLNEKLPAPILVGDADYLQLQIDLNSTQDAHILFVDKNKIKSEQIKKISQTGRLFLVDAKQPSALKNILIQIKNEREKYTQVIAVKNEIQKKRRGLEQLNNQLISESDKKIKFLEISHIEETEKNLNEKSLLHFLDFIQSESISDDFPEKLFRTIWKDLKKYGRIYTIGISNTSLSGKSKISFYDGIAQSTTVSVLDFTSRNLPIQLASMWGRPVGKILSWQLPEISRQSYLFLEVVDQQFNTEKMNTYFNERLAVLSMYLDRWMIEKEIEAIVDRWKSTFKSFTGYTHVIDEDFKIYQANYDYDKSQQGADYCYQVLAKRSSPCENCPILQNKNTSFVLKDEMSVKTYFSQFKFQNKKHYFVIYEDTTKINLLHSQIIQTEKMSTLGRLGNHLAHELNNPLTGIKSYVQTLLQDEASMQSLPSTAKSDLNEILKATIRCQKIIKNFIGFSQKKEPVLEKVDFNEVLQNTIILLKTALRNHRLFVDLKNNSIRANAHDLQQVIFNLIKNSCQAMKTPGSIKIYEEIKNNKIYYHIEDTGPGFDDLILKNIFQPFMTTKTPGEGTGLGLYLSKKLINNMHANMEVTSTLKGAKISLIFDLL